MEKKAFLVPTFHHDIAYLRSEEEYTPRCFAILDEALYILENNPEYCFFMEQAWLLDEYWDARPEKQPLMKKLAQEGRFTIEPGLYAVPDMNLPDGESLYMHAFIGRRIAKETLDYEPRVCMIADCWGHHAQIPQIMKDCGYDYYAFSRCMRTDADRQNFVWKGVDGSTIRSHWMSTHYDGIGFPSEAEQLNTAELDWASAGAEGINALMAKNRQKCGDDPQYLPVGGDFTYPSRLAPELVKQLNARDDLPYLEFSAPAHALDAIDWDNEPVFCGEFESSMQGTFSTNIIIKQLDRKYSGELFAVEAMAAVELSRAELEDAWKLHLKNQFHDIACGTICNAALRDVEADFRALDHMLTREKRKLTRGKGEKAYFNGLPFERTVQVPEGVITLAPLAFTPASKAVKPVNAAYELPLCFETPYYRAEIGKDGYLTSLTDRETGRQLIKHDSALSFGSLAMQLDYGDSWWEFEPPQLDRVTQAYTCNRPDPLNGTHGRTFGARINTAKVTRADSDSIEITQTGEISFWITNIAFVTTVTLSKHDRMIRYSTEFKNNCKDFRLRAVFASEGLTKAYRQIPYAVMPFGDGIQACQRFAYLTDGKAALTVINRGTPSYSTDEDTLIINLMRSAAMEYKCDSSDSYGIGRDYRFDYAVAGCAAGNDSALWETALDFNTPVLTSNMPEAVRALQVSGAYISAVRETENGLFFRLYNPTDKPADVTVFAEGAQQAHTVDGLMNIKESLPCENGKAALTLPPYRVQGVILA